MQDHAATLALLHRDKAGGAVVRRLAGADAVGAGRSASGPRCRRICAEVLAGDYTSAASADDFHGDYLVERANPPEGRPVGPERTEPVSGFARQVRARRRLDTAWSLAALNRGLGGSVDDGRTANLFEDRLAKLEDRIGKRADCRPWRS